MKKTLGASVLVLAAACSGAPSPEALKAAADSAAAAALASVKPVTLSSCIDAVLKEKSGTIVKLEVKTENNVETLEFDVVGTDGRMWDIECDATKGAVVEVEEEVKDAKAPAFAAKAKISLADAQKAALAAHPGEVTEVEYEIEPNGDASYEFDIRMADGTEMKVEVNAADGAIVEANVEKFQIGVEK